MLEGATQIRKTSVERAKEGDTSEFDAVWGSMKKGAGVGGRRYEIQVGEAATTAPKLAETTLLSEVTVMLLCPAIAIALKR